MAYAYARIGYDAAHQWETRNITNFTGKVHAGAILVGASSGATAILVLAGTDFSFSIISLQYIRYNGTAFTGGETVNIYSISGGASQGSCTFAASASATNIHPVVIVTGTDTANLFAGVYGASVSGGWAYHSTTYTKATLNCSIMVGNPFQVAVTSAVAKNEAVTLNGSLFVMGNSTYATTFTMGVGTYGDTGSTGNGCTIINTETAPYFWFGGCRYGKFNCFASTITAITTGWASDFTNVTVSSAIGLGGMFLVTFPVSTTGYDVTDVVRLYNVSINAGLALAHGNLVFDKVYIGSAGTYGFVFLGPGNFTAENLVILDSATVTDGFGFISSGTKTFINCVVDPTDFTGFWSNYSTIHQYSFDLAAKTPAGDAIEDMRVRAWDGTQDPLADSPKFDASTNASGVLATQYLTYATSGIPGYVSFNPFFFFLTLMGFRDIIQTKTLTEAIEWDLSFDNRKDDFE